MEPSTVQQHLQIFIQQQKSSTSILILTDVFGATPCNIAKGLTTEHQMRIISGVNLPMLLKVLNYPQLSLDELVEKALQGGQAGIIECPLPSPSDANPKGK
jgi:PTS system ascorbate-specific IIA component